MKNGINGNSKEHHNLSSRGRVIIIITLFIFIALLLQGVIYLQGNVFDGVRSYVRGEGLWAKAQKDSVLYLHRYSYSFNEADYQAYLDSIAVTLGDKKARLALSESPPDINKASAGFLQGQNSPLDIDAMIWFFLNFKKVKYLKEAINIWTQGDNKIEELASTAEELRQEIKYSGKQPQKIISLREKIHNLNLELLVLENSFSQVLGEGARWVKNITWLISISILIAFVSIGILISSQIIKGIDKSEKKLRASESRFRSLKDSNTIGIVSWRMDGLIEEANENFLNMLGYRSTDIESGNINWKALTPKHLEPLDHQAVSEILDHGRCEPYEKALIHKEGHPIPVYIGASSLDGDKDQGVAFVMDLSERKNSEEQMRLAATVFASSNDGIMITDPFMHIISANQALCNMTGYSEEELVGSKPSILKSGHTLDEQYQDMWRSLLTRGHWQGDIVDRNKSGALIPMRISISSVKDSQQNISHFVSILSDISKRKAQEDHLRQLAHYDTLTGLPNRILLNDRIEHLLKRSSRNQSQFAILFFDLDNFKPVNDRYGHLVGDKLLQVVANRLTKNVRGTDTVTRLGGDEFVMLLEDVADRDAVEQIIKKTTDSLCTPCNIDGNEINISVSIGVSIYPEDGRDAESLLYHADIAMYDMKETRHIQRARTEKQ